MWFDVGVMIGEGLDAVGRETLLSNPLEGLPLEPFVLTHAGGNHPLPRLAGIAAIGEEQDELALSILDFDGTEAFAVAGDVHHHHRAVAGNAGTAEHDENGRELGFDVQLFGKRKARRGTSHPYPSTAKGKETA